MQLSREGIQRMVEGAGGGSGSGGGIGANDLIGYATEVWVNKNFLSIEFFSKLFKAYNGNTEVTPNDTETTITNIKAMFGFWTEQYISALGQGSGGGGGGASALTDLVDVEFSGTPSNGQVLKYNGTTHKWYNGTDEGLTSLPWIQITGKPTTLSGYGITDAKIVNGTITLGSNSITPLTSFTETDPTVPAWAKASTKPSYAFSEITGSVAFSQLPTIYWADVAVSNLPNNNTSPQFGSVRLKPGSANYGGYLYFGDGSYAYICEPTDDSLQYKVGTSKTHIFTVGSTNRMEVNSSGLTVNGGLSITGFIDGATNIELKPSSSYAGNGGYIDFHYNQSSSDYTSRIIEDASGRLYLQATNGIRIGDCVITWDSSNNALKIQKTSGSANLYVTGGVTALA